ncbi:MAG: B12-binding domain-containing radical SAM protein, partial [Nitrospinota bacterium]
MTRVLMIYPEFPETFWGYQRALKFLGIGATHPPLGLLTVAGMLPREYDVRLVDLNVAKLRERDLRDADIVLTGGMMIQRPSVEWIIDRCNRAAVPVVVGGPDVTSSHEEIAGRAHMVLGEAERPEFVEVLERMCRTRDPIVLDLRDESPDINRSPLPRYDIIPLKQYVSMALQISRGCPFKCEFCDIPTLFGKTTRYKSADRTVEELELLYKRGWRGSVFWVDDNFIGNKKSAKLLLPDVIDWQKAHGMPFQFYTQASINMAADGELLSAMKEAGFDSVFLGIETPIDKSLRETKKLQNVKWDLLESVKKIQQSGMEVMAGFIIGFDNDPLDIDRHLIRFIQDSGIPVAMTGLLTAVPGSPLYDRFKAENRLLETSAVREGNNTFQFGFNYKTLQDPEALVRAYKNVLLEVYGKPENYFRRVETLYDHLETSRVSSSAPLSARRIWAFFKSILMIPRSRYGRAYGRFLFRTLLKRPSRFTDAVRQGIVGLHFYELTHDKVAVHEFDGFIRSAIQRVREAYQRERLEGGKYAAQVLADAREMLKRLPATTKEEMKVLYKELEL